MAIGVTPMEEDLIDDVKTYYGTVNFAMVINSCSGLDMMILIHNAFVGWVFGSTWPLCSANKKERKLL